MKKIIGIVAVLFALSIVAIVWGGEQAKSDVRPTKKAEGNVFYVYSDASSRLNHWCPSGWAGDYSDMKYAQNFSTNPAKGKTCIRVAYSAERKQGAGWAGIFFQNPCSNWATMKNAGYDLTGFTALKFYARGEKGGELVDKFMVGGITDSSEQGDSDSEYTDSIELTKAWREYTIPLKGRDLSHLISGFSFFFNGEYNPDGLVMYLDEIRYEKIITKLDPTRGGN